VPRRHLLRATALILLALSSCRFQDLTPGGPRHDEVAVQSVVASFYQAIGAKDGAGLQRVALSSATALVATDRAPPVLVPLRTMVDVPERRNQGGGAHIMRTELRADGDVATDRVVVVARSSDGRREYEATDVLSIARRDGGWRVAHVVFGPWHSRSAP
jgi:ketosteroid isomerase-like protein